LFSDVRAAAGGAIEIRFVQPICSQWDGHEWNLADVRLGGSTVDRPKDRALSRMNKTRWPGLLDEPAKRGSAGLLDELCKIREFDGGENLNSQKVTVFVVICDQSVFDDL